MAREAERNDYFDEELEALAQAPDGEDDLDAALEARMRRDDRLESGVPADQRHDDIGFIQFSGITRPDLANEHPATVAQDDDLDPSVPVSFYEPGVADVDSSMAPVGSEDGPLERDVILPLRPPPVTRTPAPDDDDEGTPPSAAALKDLIAELSGGELTPEDLEITGNDAIESDSPSDEQEDSLPELEAGARVDAIEADSLSIEPEDLGPELEAGARVDAIEADSLTAEPEDFGSKPGEEAPSEVLDALDIFASALAQPPSPAPPQGEAADPPQMFEPNDAIEAPPTPVPAQERDNALKARMAPQLNEAEQLMAALDAAPAHVRPETEFAAEDDPAEETWAPAAVSPDVFLDESFGQAEQEPFPAAEREKEYTLPARQRDDSPPSNRRSSRGGRKRRRALRALAILSTLALCAVALFAAIYFFVLPRFGPPEDAYARAMENWNDQNYLAASKDFELFGQRNPGSPNRAEAQFRAALSKQSAALTQDRDTRDRLNREALAMFETYIAENPLHRKVARAESLCGVLLFELGDYEGSITRLRNARRQVSDPDAALAGLRTLAAAYSKLGQLDDAESTYLQAAVLPGNYTRDVDYLALGDLFSRHAEMATSQQEREAYHQKAAEYWTLTLSLAAADPKAKKEVQAKLNMIDAMQQLDEADAAATSTPTDTANTADGVTVVEVVEDGTPVDTGLPDAPGSETPTVIEVPAAEPDPMEEAAFLERNS